MIIIYDPEINLFIDTNHKLYVVILPILGTWALTPLWVIVEAVAVT